MPASRVPRSLEPVETGGVVGLLLHHPFERQPLAAGPVPGPVGQHERGLRGVADDAAVGAAVGQTGHGPGMQQHLAGRLEVAVGVVEDRDVEQPVAVVVEHGLVGDLERRRGRSPRRWRPASVRARARNRAACRGRRWTGIGLLQPRRGDRGSGSHAYDGVAD